MNLYEKYKLTFSLQCQKQELSTYKSMWSNFFLFLMSNNTHFICNKYVHYQGKRGGKGGKVHLIIYKRYFECTIVQWRISIYP